MYKLKVKLKWIRKFSDGDCFMFHTLSLISTHVICAFVFTEILLDDQRMLRSYTATATSKLLSRRVLSSVIQHPASNSTCKGNPRFLAARAAIQVVLSVSLFVS